MTRSIPARALLRGEPLRLNSWSAANRKFAMLLLALGFTRKEGSNHQRTVWVHHTGFKVLLTEVRMRLQPSPEAKVTWGPDIRIDSNLKSLLAYIRKAIEVDPSS